MNILLVLFLLVSGICLKHAHAQDDPDMFPSSLLGDMIWHYYELRAPDVYFTTSASGISINDLAEKHYGHSDFFWTIWNANPNLQTDAVIVGGKYWIKKAQYPILLPSIVECVRTFGIRCIRITPDRTSVFWQYNPELLRPTSVYTDLDDKPYPMTIPTTGARLLQNQIPQDVQDQTNIPRIGAAPQGLTLLIQNDLPQELSEAYDIPKQGIRSGSIAEIYQTTNLGTVNTYTFVTENFYGQSLFINVDIYLDQVPRYPFMDIGKGNSIQISAWIGVSPVTPKDEVLAEDGLISYLFEDLYLNATIAIDNMFGSVTAQLILKEYWPSATIAGLINEPHSLNVAMQRTLQLEPRTQKLFSYDILSNQALNKAAQFWRIAPVDSNTKDGRFRLINYRYPDSALTFVSKIRNLQFQKLDDANEEQVWTIIPVAIGSAPALALPTDIPTTEKKFFIRSASGNACLSLNTLEKSPVTSSTNIFPLRVEDCQPNVANGKIQIFIIKIAADSSVITWN